MWPQFRQMLDAASSDDAPFEEILVWEFSRFTRKREGASRGFWVSPYAPYGYQKVQVADGARKRPRLALNPPADAVVRRIFESEFLRTSEITETRAFVRSFVKAILVRPGRATIHYTIPTPEDSPIGRAAAAEVALKQRVGAFFAQVGGGGEHGHALGAAPYWVRILSAVIPTRPAWRRLFEHPKVGLHVTYCELSRGWSRYRCGDYGCH